MRILLTNDDGIHAEGLRALKAALDPEHEVIVVAPRDFRSGSSHALTLSQPLRVEEVPLGNGAIGYAVDGMPVDCVKLAVRHLLADRRPDLVISGLNHGSNVGINVFYSGTIAAAVEGSLLGFPALALSVERGGSITFAQAATIAKNIIGRMIETDCRPGSLLSVNIPDRPPDRIRGIRIARQNVSRFATECFDRRTDPWGREYFWIQGGVEVETDNADEDTRALREGYVCITPLKLDMTDPVALEAIRGWDLRHIADS